MSRPDEERTPEEWRDILASFEYPEEIKRSRWRGRAGRKRAHREAVRRRTKEWVRQERRRDPIRPGGAIIIVALVLGIGFGARYLLPGDSGHAAPRAAASSSPSASVNAPSAPPSSGEAGVSPSPSSSVDLGTPEHVAEEAARLYLTRNPPVDGKYTAAIQRAAPYMTPPLAENLAASSDPAWERLVSQGGVSRVTAVKVEPASAKGLSPDIPGRVWRQITATVDIQGYTHSTETTTLQFELTNSDGGWRVSRIVGL